MEEMVEVPKGLKMTIKTKVVTVTQRLTKMDGKKTSMVIMTTDFRAGSSA
jgi:hypothetical protein